MQVTDYADEVTGTLRSALGPAAPTAELDALTAAAQALQAAQTQVAWAQALATWDTARDQLTSHMKDFLLAGVPDIPGLDSLLPGGWDTPDGLHGDLDIGPLHLAFASSALTIQPKLPDGTVLPPMVVGPFRPSSIDASLGLPGAGAKVPGGGAIVRLPAGNGFGGTLHLPLGPASVEAAAILEQLPDGDPAFLAVMGVSFTPPIQLSFGFSLDRVGGIVAVNHRMDTDALAAGVRTGAGGDVLFAIAPPKNPAALADALERFFPAQAGRHIVGPTLRVSWLSLGSAGSLLALDLGVVLELPTGKVAILGVARASIPGMEPLLKLRIDLLGIFDPAAQLVSIDASLVDSHALGIFSLYGDAAMRVHWGDDGYTVLSIGGFYPGFNPEPARLPALRRVGMATELPIPGLSIRAEGYFAVTSNTIQLGCHLDVEVGLGLTAHGFLQVDALVQFRPFHFEADVAAGFDVRVFGCSFGGVRLDGRISGPGPVTIHGRLTIETFLFDVSWDQTFTIGSGPGDVVGRAPRLLTVLAKELTVPGNLRADRTQDDQVVLEPRPGRADVAAVPATGSLIWRQHRAPLGLPVERVDGQPLDGAQTVTVAGPPVTDVFSPGSYRPLTDAEALNSPAFDRLQAGVVLSPPAAAPAPAVTDDRAVKVIVIKRADDWRTEFELWDGRFDLTHISSLVDASRSAPALGDRASPVQALPEAWATTAGGAANPLSSHTAALQTARLDGTVALAVADLQAPVDVAGV